MFFLTQRDTPCIHQSHKYNKTLQKQSLFLVCKKDGKDRYARYAILQLTKICCIP